MGWQRVKALEGSEGDWIMREAGLPFRVMLQWGVPN